MRRAPDFGFAERARLLLALAVLALVGWLCAGLFPWSGVFPEREPEVPLASTDSAQLAGGSSLVEPVASRERVAAPAQRSFSSAEAGRVLGALSSEGSLEMLVLEGELVVLEADGSETRGLDARLDFTTQVGAVRSGHRVQVENGRWALRFLREADGWFTAPDGSRHPAELPSAEIEVSSPALYDGFGRVRLAPELPRLRFGTDTALIRLIRSGGLTIRVEDAKSRAPLERISILLTRNWLNSPQLHPGDRANCTTVLVDGKSPLRLRDAMRERFPGESLSCLVGAPGYAWTAVPLTLQQDGERLIRLERGGDLQVCFAGNPPSRVSRLLLFAEGTNRELARSAMQGLEPIELDGLPVGRYELRAESALSAEDKSVTLGRGAVAIEAGQKARVTLTLEPLPELVTATLVGKLRLPSEWRLKTFTLLLELLDPPLGSTTARRFRNSTDLLKLSRESFQFEFPGLQTGRYRLSLPQVCCTTFFELSPGGLSDLEFEVPPPAEIEVRLRNQQTGAFLDNLSLYWSCSPIGFEPPSDWPAISPLSTTETPLPGHSRFQFRVPRGRIWISPTRHGRGGEEYFAAVGSFLAEDEGQYVIDLNPYCTVHLLLRDGTNLVPWPQQVWVGESEQHGQEISGQGSGTLGFWAKAASPGRYRIPVPKIQGYEPVEPVEVDLRPGETQELEIQLVRLP